MVNVFHCIACFVCKELTRLWWRIARLGWRHDEVKQDGRAPSSSGNERRGK